MGQRKNFGWIPDYPDHRDFKYKIPLFKSFLSPPVVDLRNKMPCVYNQDILGSCTAQGIAAADQFAQMKQELPNQFMPSRLFIYYNEREMEGTVNEDSGAMIRDGIKSLAKQGVCPESWWPYDITKFRDKPTIQCYAEAAKHTAISYMRLAQNLRTLRHCLVEGYPFVFGFAVYEYFESDEMAKTGVLKMPEPGEHMIGGHCCTAVGFQKDKKAFLIRNSWGEKWADGGHFWMPYEYILNPDLACDFWTIRAVK